jgi:benzoyl-CoA reductase subunit B
MVQQIVKLCREYEIDGVVLHAARTCRAFSNPQFIIADAVQKQLGLPVAMIEGDMVDESFYKDELIDSRVEAMLEASETRLRRGITAYA